MKKLTEKMPQRNRHSKNKEKRKQLRGNSVQIVRNTTVTTTRENVEPSNMQLVEVNLSSNSPKIEEEGSSGFDDMTMKNRKLEIEEEQISGGSIMVSTGIEKLKTFDIFLNIQRLIYIYIYVYMMNK